MKRRTKRRTKKKTKKKRYSIKNARMVSRKRYSVLLKKKRRPRKENKDLDRALFVNYCKCVKKLKYSKKYGKGAEYPICMNSIYKQRGIKPPSGVTKKCKRYT